MTAPDGLRSVLNLVPRISPLSLRSGGSGGSQEVRLMGFDVLAGLMEPRIPVGMGIFAF